jgi:hypothetical protein
MNGHSPEPAETFNVQQIIERRLGRLIWENIMSEARIEQLALENEKLQLLVIQAQQEENQAAQPETSVVEEGADSGEVRT